MQRTVSKPLLAGCLALCFSLAVFPTSQGEAGQPSTSKELHAVKGGHGQDVSANGLEGTNEFDFFMLDPVSPGSLEQWEPFLDPRNPVFTYEEVLGEYVEGTAIRTSAVGNTISQCRTQHIARHFDISGNALDARLKAYLEFEFSGTRYNLPMIQIVLYDQAGEEIDSRIYYGKDIIGSYHLEVIFPNPSYIELPDNKGDMIIDLSYFGDHDFSSLELRLRNYTCIGTNSIIFDNLRVANADSIIFQDRFEISD